MKEVIDRVKEKREFSGLPDSLIEKVLLQKGIKNKSDEEKIKLARAFLRKYFGVFLTNKVLKGKDAAVLESHISSRKRDYGVFYEKIYSIAGKDFKTIVDLGSGMNGFSYDFISEAFGDISYVGFEGTRQLCDLQNEYFEREGYKHANVVWGDLFNFSQVGSLLKEASSPKIILLLQVIDALENVEPNSSKEFLSNMKNNLSKKDVLVISNPLKSISGKNRFNVKRRWLEEFITQNFELIDKFDLFDEEFLIAKPI